MTHLRQIIAGLKTAFHAGALQFHGHLLPLAEPHAFASWLRLLFRHDWVVYSKRPFGGPEHVLRYLGAYTHRVAISNSRLVALADGNVCFSLARLRSRQQEEDHDSGGRRVLAPLPSPPVAARLRAHPQLRISC